MADAASLLPIAGSGTLALAMMAAAGLKGWRAWLHVKRLQLRAGRVPSGTRAPAALVELRARVRRLEAIADGGGAPLAG